MIRINRTTHTDELMKTSDEFVRPYGSLRTFMRFDVGHFPIERIVSFGGDLIIKRGCIVFDASSLYIFEHGQLFPVNFIRNSQFLTTFGTAAGQNAATISGQHSLSETMLVFSLSV